MDNDFTPSQFIRGSTSCFRTQTQIAIKIDGCPHVQIPNLSGQIIINETSTKMFGGGCLKSRSLDPYDP